MTAGTSPTTPAPYGSWRSPISARTLVEQAVGLSDIVVSGDTCYWNERRLDDHARQVVVAARPGETARDVLPAPYSARSLVHEYGGAPYGVFHDTVYFTNLADQRIYAVRRGAAPFPITAAPAVTAAVRYADFAISRDGTALFAVRERHGVDHLEGADGVVNDLVAVSTDGVGEPTVIASGHDFYASPRLSPDGRRLAFIAWDHPNMPWDESALYLSSLDDAGTVGPPQRIAGARAESISQPRFAADGVLHYLSDRTGFASLYTETGEVACDIGRDLGGPDWVFGQASYAFVPDGRIVVAASADVGDELLVVDGTQARSLCPRFNVWSSLHVLGGTVVALAGSSSEPLAVVTVDPDTGAVNLLRSSRAFPIDADYIAEPRSITFPTTDGSAVHALFYPPTNPEFAAPTGEDPPLVVVSHGGPTARATPLVDLRVQYLTSRGLAVVDVDYGGSSGYGRRYQERLNGLWGVVDVADCAAAARHLAQIGLVDATRLAIRGGSAGGLTTLGALAFTDVFSVGASHYGVSDLESLAHDTHKFESRYTDRLVGPLPDTHGVYTARSPLLHASEISCPVIFFQGLEDAIVPPSQTESMVAALSARGIPVAYLSFPGEQHGFRRAETITTVVEAELAFFAAVLGFEPSDPLPPIEIEHREAISSRSGASIAEHSHEI